MHSCLEPRYVLEVGSALHWNLTQFSSFSVAADISDLTTVTRTCDVSCVADHTGRKASSALYTEGGEGLGTRLTTAAPWIHKIMTYTITVRKSG